MRQKTLSTSKLQEQKLLPVRERLSQRQVEQLKIAFDLFDEDNSGKIDPKQIQKILQQLGLDKRNQVVFNMISDLQTKKRPIDFEQFLQIIYSRLGDTKSIDGLQRVFSLYDNDSAGYIDIEKMKFAARELGQTMNQQQILEMMHNTHILNNTQSNEGFTFQQFYEIVTRKKY